MTRAEAWLEARSRLKEAPRSVVAYEREGLTRVVIADREAGYIEVELGPHDPFLLLDRIQSWLAGKEWDADEAIERLDESEKRLTKEMRRGTH